MPESVWWIGHLEINPCEILQLRGHEAYTQKRQHARATKGKSSTLLQQTGTNSILDRESPMQLQLAKKA
jgi:hypothetical protein